MRAPHQANQDQTIYHLPFLDGRCILSFDETEIERTRETVGAEERVREGSPSLRTERLLTVKTRLNKGRQGVSSLRICFKRAMASSVRSDRPGSTAGKTRRRGRVNHHYSHVITSASVFHFIAGRANEAGLWTQRGVVLRR